MAGFGNRVPGGAAPTRTSRSGQVGLCDAGPVSPLDALIEGPFATRAGVVAEFEDLPPDYRERLASHAWDRGVSPALAERTTGTI